MESNNHIIRQVFDISWCDIDLVFVENNKFLYFQSNEEEPTLAVLLNGIAVLMELWMPDYFEISLRSPGESNNEEHFLRIPAPSLSAVDFINRLSEELGNNKNFNLIFAEDSYGAEFRLESSLKGLNRIAIPGGSDRKALWNIVDCDGITPRSYRIEETQSLSGIETLWFRLEDVLSGSYLSLHYDDFNNPEIRLCLGPIFYNPHSDTRDPEQLIRGVQLSKWQALHQALLKKIIDKMDEAGWQLMLKHSSKTDNV